MKPRKPKREGAYVIKSADGRSSTPPVKVPPYGCLSTEVPKDCAARGPVTEPTECKACGATVSPWDYLSAPTVELPDARTGVRGTPFEGDVLP